MQFLFCSLALAAAVAVVHQDTTAFSRSCKLCLSFPLFCDWSVSSALPLPLPLPLGFCMQNPSFRVYFLRLVGWLIGSCLFVWFVSLICHEFEQCSGG
ncbi:hypothetical protein LZ31DRAFT_117098 [Colletotrichum somersetense]|nr:hypothetical protein LZ31DRAFT_117098 [Colletotrichum somersetense]